jgi:hypothetical protein
MPSENSEENLSENVESREAPGTHSIFSCTIPHADSPAVSASKSSSDQARTFYGHQPSSTELASVHHIGTSREC